MADTTAPTLAIASLNGSFADTGGTIRFSLTFSEAVTGVAASAFSLRTSSTVTGASILGVTGAGAEYVIEVDPGLGFGTIQLNAGAAGIVDLAGNALQLARTYTPTAERQVSGVGFVGVAGDINGDGQADAVVPRGDSKVNVFFGSQQGALFGEQAFDSGGINSNAIVVDLNRDGKADVLVGNSSNTINVLLGAGDPTLAPAVAYVAGPTPAGGAINQPTSIAVGDIDGDGRTDVVANQSAGTGLSILRGNGDGTLAAFRSLALPYSVTRVAVADFNGDGKLDILAQRSSSFVVPGFDILLGAGDGTFGAPAGVALQDISQSMVGDLNGDGRPDVVVRTSDNTIRTYINRGDATFEAKAPALAGSLTALADLDGDGFVDAISSTGGFSLTENWLLRGDGAGGFAARTLLLGGSSRFVSDVGDFNGDGQLDLLTSSFQSTAAVGTAIASTGSSQTGPSVTIDDFAANASTSGRLAVGGSAFGFIEQQSDRDWFRIDLVAGQTYRFAANTFGQISVFNAGGQSVATMPARGFDFAAGASGTYFLDLSATRLIGTSYTVTATQLATQPSDFTTGDDAVALAVAERSWQALAGNDSVTGSAGADRIAGGAGNDWLSGGDVGLTADGEALFRTYALLDRSPDVGGFQFWSRNEGLVASFTGTLPLQSPEFASIYGGLSNEAFVAKLFTTALDRSPTADEAALWGQRLTNTNRSNVVVDFTGLPELQSRNVAAQAEFAAIRDRDAFGSLHRLYDAAFNRLADAGGFQGWTEQRDQGASLDSIVPGFVNSPEFRNAIKGLTNEQIVTKLYANALGRAPDAAGLAGWKAALDGQVSLGTVLLGFAESAEMRALQPTAPAAFMATLTTWSDTLDGGLGDDVLTGGRGADVFRFDRLEAGSDRIIAFESCDRVQFANFGYASAAEAQAKLSQVGADVVFQDQGETITFVNAQLAAVRAATFEIV